nr:MAG TPA: hypothetical protein [Bacteriophage sp.]
MLILSNCIKLVFVKIRQKREDYIIFSFNFTP